MGNNEQPRLRMDRVPDTLYGQEESRCQKERRYEYEYVPIHPTSGLYLSAEYQVCISHKSNNKIEDSEYLAYRHQKYLMLQYT